MNIIAVLFVTGLGCIVGGMIVSVFWSICSALFAGPHDFDTPAERICRASEKAR